MRSDLQTEQALLGCAMLGDPLAKEFVRRIDSKMFYSSNHQTISEAIRDLVTSEKSVDIVSVASILRAWDKFGEIGGGAALKECTDATATTSHFDHYLTETRRMYYHREIEKAAHRVAENPDDDTIAELSRLALLRASELKLSFFHLKKDLPGAVDKIISPQAEDDFIDTGFAAIDKLLFGFKAGDVMTIGGRPGSGKTALKLKLAMNWAKMGKRVFYYSTEMKEEQIVSRILPGISKVEGWKFRRSRLTKANQESVVDAAAAIYETHDLYIQGRAKPSLESIHSVIAKINPDVIIIDYLQRCKFPKAESRAYAIEAFMEGLKDIALDRDVRIVLGAQLKREADYSKDRPKMADLRDSSAIEHQSDIVGLLYNTTEDESKPYYDIEFVIDKNRNGLVGAAPIVFDKDYINFVEGHEDRVPDSQKDEAADSFEPWQPELEKPSFA